MPGMRWTKEEEQYLRDNFVHKTCQEISQDINKTVRAVQHKYNELKLIKPQPKINDELHYITIKQIYKKKYYKQNRTFIIGECRCGTVKEFLLSRLIDGNTRSCGCLQSKIQKARAVERNFKHGKSDYNNRLFRIWCGMKSRCYTKSNISYKNYGQRGIKVCEEWRKDYLVFEKWAMENGYTDGLTIDRERVNEDYSPDNCKWSTIEEQQLNKRSSVLITAFGETKILAEWGRDPRCKIDHRMIKYRIDHGWSPENAISIPPLKHDRSYGEPT